MFEIGDGCSIMTPELQCWALLRMQFKQTHTLESSTSSSIQHIPEAQFKKIRKPMIYKASAEAVPLSNRNSCLHIYIQLMDV